jgi:hypothetical protein
VTTAIGIGYGAFMITPMHVFSAAALALGGAAAQIAPGPPAPEVEFDKVLNGGPTSWQQLDGRLVLLDFSETW